MDSFFKRALPYLELGWPVFPTRPDKVPLCPHGRNDATCESLTIERWSEEFPQANVSIRTGQASEVAVIDIDNEAGERWVAHINKTWKRLPETAEAKSGRGRHLYFRYLPCRSADGKLAPGIDLKAGGGSITAPVSLHASGRLYEWAKPPFDRHLPLLPLWIVRELAPPVQPPHRSNYNRNEPPTPERLDKLLRQVVAASVGQRNHTLNKVAFIFGLMVKDGHLTADKARDMLLEAARSAGLTKFESMLTIKSGLRSGQSTLKRAK